MRVSKKIEKQLGILISGNSGPAPYMSGPQLVDFFNECGFDDYYGQGFPSRWAYAAGKIEQTNGTDQLRVILEEFVDPRRYGGDEPLVEEIVQEVNAMLKYDGYALVKVGQLYKVADTKGSVITATSIHTIGHEFVSQQIEKCNQKLIANDFNGAITNARTLTEAVLIHIIETVEKTEIKNDGNLLNLWGKAKKCLKIDLKKDDLPESIFQILAGLDGILNGLAALSNNAGDRHATKFNTKRHHAKLAVNVTMTVSDFLIDVMVLRTESKSESATMGT